MAGRIDREAIQRAALRIADADGLDAVTMRNLAQELGVGVMSLYHYVKTKDELVDGLAEVAIAELDIKVEAGRPWDQELIRIGVELHRALRAHPSAIQLLLTHPQPPPSFVAAADKLLATLLDAGLSRQHAVEGLATFQSYVIGHSVLSYSHSGADEYYLGDRDDARPGLHMIVEHLRAQLTATDPAT
jgi:AcrR family transcriptional regulator